MAFDDKGKAVVNRLVDGFFTFITRAEDARRAFAQLGDNDAIAVVEVNNARDASMIA
ncbi:MAG TPA: hypothetical protein VKF63_06470 [Terracidiphilus sp.]|nr:hypothetical protein [Terracidiphilus sp.]